MSAYSTSVDLHAGLRTGAVFGGESAPARAGQKAAGALRVSCSCADRVAVIGREGSPV